MPAVGRMRSSSSRIVVLLPAPFGPRNPNTSPRSTRRSSPSRARIPPGKVFESAVGLDRRRVCHQPNRRGPLLQRLSPRGTRRGPSIDTARGSPGTLRRAATPVRRRALRAPARTRAGSHAGTAAVTVRPAAVTLRCLPAPGGTGQVTTNTRDSVLIPGPHSAGGIRPPPARRKG